MFIGRHKHELVQGAPFADGGRPVTEITNLQSHKFEVLTVVKGRGPEKGHMYLPGDHLAPKQHEMNWRYEKEAYKTPGYIFNDVPDELSEGVYQASQIKAMDYHGSSSMYGLLGEGEISVNEIEIKHDSWAPEIEDQPTIDPNTGVTSRHCCSGALLPPSIGERMHTRDNMHQFEVKVWEEESDSVTVLLMDPRKDYHFVKKESWYPKPIQEWIHRALEQKDLAWIPDSHKAEESSQRLIWVDLEDMLANPKSPLAKYKQDGAQDGAQDFPTSHSFQRIISACGAKLYDCFRAQTRKMVEINNARREEFNRIEQNLAEEHADADVPVLSTDWEVPDAKRPPADWNTLNPGYNWRNPHCGPYQKAPRKGKGKSTAWQNADGLANQTSDGEAWVTHGPRSFDVIPEYIKQDLPRWEDAAAATAPAQTAGADGNDATAEPEGQRFVVGGTANVHGGGVWDQWQQGDVVPGAKGFGRGSFGRGRGGNGGGRSAPYDSHPLITPEVLQAASQAVLAAILNNQAASQPFRQQPAQQQQRGQQNEAGTSASSTDGQRGNYRDWGNSEGWGASTWQQGRSGRRDRQQ